MNELILALVQAGFPALVTVVALYATYRAGRAAAEDSRKSDMQKLAVELRLRQLNEFYGPIAILIGQSKHMYGALREGENEDWHLLNNIEQVKADDRKRALAEKILDVNLEIEKLLTTKGGLADGERPESFDQFLAHLHSVKSALRDGVHEVPKYNYYPKKFDEDIAAGEARVRVAVDAVLSAKAVV